MRNHKVTFIAIALLVGCGGESTGSTKGTTPSADVARTVGGEAITTADGNAVSKKAHGKWESALDEFESNEKSGWTSAKCSSSEKSFERAADAQGGGFAEADYMAGLALSRCGDDGAYKHYEEALKVDSKFCKARVALGLRDLENGRTAQAKSTFEQSIKDDPQCTSGYTNLAIVQRAQGQSEEALKNLRRALAIESDYLAAFNQMALLHYDRGRKGNAAELDLAEVVCRQAQMLDADYAPHLQHLGPDQGLQGRRHLGPSVLPESYHSRSGSFRGADELWRGHDLLPRLRGRTQGLRSRRRARAEQLRSDRRARHGSPRPRAFLRGRDAVRAGQANRCEAPRSLLQPRCALSGLHVGLGS